MEQLTEGFALAVCDVLFGVFVFTCTGAVPHTRRTYCINGDCRYSYIEIKATHGMSTVLDGMIYTVETGSWPNNPSVWRFDPSADTWRSLGTTPYRDRILYGVWCVSVHVYTWGYRFHGDLEL